MMDNGIGNVGVNGNMPSALGIAVPMNDRVKADFDNLSETEKEHIILKCKDAKSKAEMDRIIDSISPPGSIGNAYKRS